MISALAGRRIDPLNTDHPRFPLANIPLVRERLRPVLKRGDTALVCSAACGADLVALELAGVLKIRRRIVLPYAREQFRQTSVVDRPGDWGPLFDRIMDEAETARDTVVLPCDPHNPDAYAKANVAILAEAERLSGEAGEDILAIVVWDGKSRGQDDLTAAFLSEAKARGHFISEITTVGN